jgi:hypothetical protein
MPQLLLSKIYLKSPSCIITRRALCLGVYLSIYAFFFWGHISYIYMHLFFHVIFAIGSSLLLFLLVIESIFVYSCQWTGYY